MRKQNRTKAGNKGRVSFIRSIVMVSGMKEVSKHLCKHLKQNNTCKNTCCKQQHIVQVVIWSLDSVNSYLGEVLITCEEGRFFLNGLNPVLHLWMVFNDLKGRNWNEIALFDTLEKRDISVIISSQSVLLEVTSYNTTQVRLEPFYCYQGHGKNYCAFPQL